MAAELQATEEAFGQLETLRADPTRKSLRRSVDAALAALEDDPAQEDVRRVRFVSNPTIWVINVRTRDDDWIVLWGMSPTDAVAVVVRYIGPTPTIPG